MTTAQHLYFDGPKPGEHQHISPLKAKKLASENLQLKKNILTQEFKEAHRERIIQSSNENNAVKGQEHKVIFLSFLDYLL